MAATCIVGSICVISASCLICLAAYELSPILSKVNEEMERNGDFGEEKLLGLFQDDEDYNMNKSNKRKKKHFGLRKSKKRDGHSKKKSHKKDSHHKNEQDLTEHDMEFVSVTELGPFREDSIANELERIEERERRNRRDLAIIEERDRRTRRDLELMEERQRKRKKGEGKTEENRRRGKFPHRLGEKVKNIKHHHRHENGDEYHNHKHKEEKDNQHHRKKLNDL
ncbi:hypothetical protein WA026_001390 [Henosepilachna vigintioctopunctata]|uniref:Uncharacterized protein n=1 Tax=Henosepilachna vigintioctopunctata TaxID=420089 RepID=A0AAW1UPS6_9CUCU